MNFKKLAVLASLAVAAGASFADDIALSTAGGVMASGDVMTLTDGVLAGTAFDSDTAIIIQEGTTGNIAVIDQTTGGTGAANMAAIFQLNADGNKAIAYIGQTGTLNAAVIVQR